MKGYWIDLTCLFFTILFVVGGQFAPSSEWVEFEKYAVDAVKGITTIVGIIIAFVVFSLNHSYSMLKTEDAKNWLRKRIIVMAVVIVMCLIFVGGAYIQLFYGNLLNAYRCIAFSFLTTIGLTLESIYFMLSIGKIEY